MHLEIPTLIGRHVARLLALAVPMALLGCNPKAAVDALPDAQAVADTFFERFKSGDFDGIESLYGEAFWEVVPEETWVRVLPNVYEELGRIEQCELQNWRQTSKLGTSSGGNYVSLTYGCKHAKYESVITFVVLTPTMGGDSKIVGQNFSSLGLLLE